MKTTQGITPNQGVPGFGNTTQYKVFHLLGIVYFQIQQGYKQVLIQGDDILQLKVSPVLGFGGTTYVPIQGHSSNTRWQYFAIQGCPCIGFWLYYVT